MAEKRRSIGISLGKTLIQTIDKTRGLIPRSRFIEKFLLDGLMERKND